MSIQDNGPRDGDFVRYIEELNARVAAATAAQVAAAPKATPPVAKPAPIAPAFAIATLGIGRLFTIGLFVIGAIVAALGFLLSGVEYLVAIGIAMIAWASRRESAARRVKA